jgi:hypothetical protein
VLPSFDAQNVRCSRFSRGETPAAVVRGNIKDAFSLQNIPIGLDEGTVTLVQAMCRRAGDAGG